MSKNLQLVSALTLTAALAACGRDQPAPAPSAATSVHPTQRADSVASRYEGKVVRRAPIDGTKQDGWFFVKDGKRRWIVQAGWLDTQGLKPADVIVISSEELAAIPEDPEPLGATP
ncbi:hypothetical protein [Lysobacter sp. HA35]